MNKRKSCIKMIFVFAMSAVQTACGNGGQITFDPSMIEHQNNKPAPFSVVPASQALAIESSQTVATGYHAKLQLNPLKGTNLTSVTGHRAQMKFTVRNR